MKIRCEGCGFEEIPENFNGIQEIEEQKDGWDMRMIYIECPVCMNKVFFQHFGINPKTEIIRNKKEKCLSYSHLLTPSLEEAKTPREAAEKLLAKLKELRKKHQKG